ncbi:MAG: hypothetical protein Q7R54_02580 [bacterium]|nr:hypothetical protein [bacterium]
MPNTTEEVNSDAAAEKRIAEILKEYHPGETALAKLRAHFGEMRKRDLGTILLILRNVMRGNAMELKRRMHSTIQ